MTDLDLNSRTFKDSIAAVCDLLAQIDSQNLSPLPTHEVTDVTSATRSALEMPTDFPPLASAIVTGDHIAIALDTNLPAIDRVISALLTQLQANGAGEIDIVVSTETSSSDLAVLRSLVGELATVHLHQTEKRASFRYLGPDVHDEPVYLNRWLVDADLVLPVVTKRASDVSANGPHDLTGIYPTFTDANARRRHHQSRAKNDTWGDSDAAEQDPEAMSGTAEEPAWLLGVQLILSVTPNQHGRVAKIECGSIESARQAAIETSTADLCDFVTAVVEGGPSQQTWLNIARAAEAAVRYTQSGGTIVVWSDITEEIASHGDTEFVADEPTADEQDSEDFTPWDEKAVPFDRIGSLSEDYQIIIRSQLSADSIERIGLGSIQTPDELKRLAMAFPKRGLLRAAQYHAH